MKKFLKIILTLAVIAVVAWLFFFIKEKNKPDLGQLTYKFDSVQLTETYTDTINGFSLKYPKDWTIGQAFNSDALAYVLIFGPIGVDLTVKVWKKESSPTDPNEKVFRAKIQTIPAVIAYIKDEVTGRCGSDKSSGFSVAGLETRKFTCTIGFFDSGGSEKRTYYAFEKGNIYTIEYTTGRGRLNGSKSLESLFERITQTFVFTK